jgi:asparagine synthase (glutamine-hydrolysing)
MCGIAGLVGVHGARAKGVVQTMVRALARRGPDGEGTEVWREAVLGHRRLAIFDLSPAGHQPMVSPDGKVGVVFNGAIYNFRELRADLEHRGHPFRSNTDTEVLVHGYREWGIERLVARLEGMFAFGLWDEATGRLFLVRDRLGVKPLAYAVRNGQLAFASTVRALREGGFAGEVEGQAVTEFLEFGFVTDDRSIYRGVFKVPAASIVEWSAGRLHTRSYWDVPSPGASDTLSLDDAVEETERLFLQAVEKRLQADVPVGALLSGGIDSALVCWAVARLGAKITAFTVGTPGDPWDESSDARATARQLGIAHEVLDVSALDAPDIGELASAYAEPFACASALGLMRVSRAVASAATVLLTGDGGDDVFLGYPEHRHLWLAGNLARVVPRAAARGWRSCRRLLPRRGWSRRLRSFLDYTTGGLGAVAIARDGLPTYRRQGLLGERLAAATIPDRAMPWSLEAGRRILSDFLVYDRRTRFVGEYMTKVDGATMHHALEARSPFLDQDVWEFASRIPLGVRLHRGRLKAVLRELARRRIGERVARGRKRGFGIPVQRWLAGRWRPLAEDLLTDPLVGQEGWIRPGPALVALRDSARRGWVSKPLWYICALESWLRHERRAPRALSAAGEVVTSARTA